MHEDNLACHKVIGKPSAHAHHERQVFAKMASKEEILGGEASGNVTHPFNLLWIAQQFADSQGCSFRRIHQVTGVVIVYLQPYSADVAADDRLAFPHRLGDGQPEPFLSRFLYDYRRCTLQSVYRPVSICRQIQNMDSVISIGGISNLVKNDGCLGIVSRATSGQDKPTWHRPIEQVESLDDPDGVLKPIKA